MGGRWTEARRAILEDSRVKVTDLLVRAIAEAATRPTVFVSGSAVGYYGDRADEPITEASTAGDDVLACLCRRWEDAAQPAEALGLRVVRLRTGVVPGRAGGALARRRGDRLSRPRRSAPGAMATRIASGEPGRRFVDLQEAGPSHLWWHEHSCHADGERTVMEDRVFYTPPLGILGRLANRLFIAATLRKIFRYRGDVIRLRFGVS